MTKSPWAQPEISRVEAGSVLIDPAQETSNSSVEHQPATEFQTIADDAHSSTEPRLSVDTYFYEDEDWGKWERFKDWLGLGYLLEDIRDGLRTTRGKIKTAAGLGAAALTFIGLYETVTYLNNRAWAQYEAERNNIDPQAAELAIQLKMISEDSELFTRPRLGEHVTLDNVSRSRTYEYRGGQLDISDSDESRRVKAEEAYEYIDNPDGTETRVLKGFTVPENQGDSYSLIWNKGDEVEASNGSLEYLQVNLRLNPQTKKTESLWIIVETTEKKFEYHSYNGGVYIVVDRKTGVETRIKGTPPEARSLMVQVGSNFFDGFTENAD